MLYDSERGDFAMMLLGDVMPTRRLAVFGEERYLKLREVCASADATFANLETSVHRYLEGHQNISGGTYMTTEPDLLEDLKWLGVNLVSTANNHAFDYGEDDGLNIAAHSWAMGGARRLEDDVSLSGNPTFVISPCALNGIDNDRTRMKMDVERYVRN